MPNQLTELDENLWTAVSSHRFLGVDFGGRMTVIRLKSGGLFVHSPVRLTGSLRQELDALGDVANIAAPNKFHHLYVSDYISSYPEAKFYAAPGLSEKRKDLRFDGVLADTPEPDWKEEVKQHLFRGMPTVNEVVFLHVATGTVIFSDLIFNFSNDLSVGQKIFAKLIGAYKKPAVSRMSRYLFIRDREKAAASAKAMLSWEFDRVLLAHKDAVLAGGHHAVRDAFGFLLD
jgi:hypothetical protein